MVYLKFICLNNDYVNIFSVYMHDKLSYLNVLNLIKVFI